MKSKILFLFLCLTLVSCEEMQKPEISSEEGFLPMSDSSADFSTSEFQTIKTLCNELYNVRAFANELHTFNYNKRDCRGIQDSFTVNKTITVENDTLIYASSTTRDFFRNYRYLNVSPLNSLCNNVLSTNPSFSRQVKDLTNGITYTVEAITNRDGSNRVSTTKNCLAPGMISVSNTGLTCLRIWQALKDPNDLDVITNTDTIAFISASINTNLNGRMVHRFKESLCADQDRVSFLEATRTK